ncbi:MAG: NAD(P)-dependent oxidoreductase [Gammaproteobacteria bacterium]|nr:NAD(P)-dependent oxidoreductase [Gammaproteobacteria bacterium]
MRAVNIESLGFIGLGVMGEAMCRNLTTRGSWPVTAFDVKPEPLARAVEAGASKASSAGEIMDTTDMVITCLPGGDEVRKLVLGGDGLINRVRAGQFLVDMSTSQPSLMEEIAEVARDRDAHFADAPIARTRQAAADGTLAIMVGADQAVFDAIYPVLFTMGTDVVHCGGPGAGQVVKTMNNMVLFQTVAALAEALCIAERSGVDGNTLLNAMSKGSGDSFALRNHGIKSLLPEIYPGQAFSVKYAAKDLSYALDAARQHGVRTPGAQSVAKLFEQAIAAGDGDRYFPVIRRLLA